MSMKTIKVAAASIRNLIGQPDTSISNMEKWIEIAKENDAVELILFPELNVSGYIPAPIAHQLAETIPGPSTEKVITLAHRHNITIGYGLIEKEQDKFYCTHVLVNASNIIGKQRKIHVPAHERPFWNAWQLHRYI